MTVKGIFLGGPGVGKSSIIKSYVEGHIDPSHRTTISAAFFQTQAEYEGKQFEFGLWDTAGGEQYRSIAPIYFRGADIAFVVADSSNPSSDEDALFWTKELIARADESIVIMIVMNKIDLVDDVGEVERRAQRIAEGYGDHYFLTSALTHTGITELFVVGFEFLADRIQRLEALPEKTTEIDSKQNTKNRPYCC
jgi:small GTP-binding protein